MTGSQANFLQSLGWAIINSLWQLALLWVIYQMIISVFTKAKPASKSTLAASLLMTGFAWFIYTFFLAYTSGNTNGTVFTITSNATANNWIQRSLPYTSIVYLALLIFPLLRFTKNYRYVQVIRRYGLSKIDPSWRIFVNELAQRMGIRKPVHIWVSEWVSSPVTIGYLKPVILVPLAAINHLSPAQMEAILLHELSHIRRFDYLVNFIINCIRVVLYFNPFAKAFIRIVEMEREKSCDEIVMQFQYDSADYATALLMLEKVSHTNKILVLPAAGKHRDLLARVENIMGVSKKQPLGFRRFGGMLAGILAVICFNALLLVKEKTTIPMLAFKQDAVVMEKKKTNDLPVREIPAVIENKIKPSVAKKTENKPDLEIIDDKLAHPAFIAAGYQAIPDIQLSKKEEQQVKEALEASKKVLENEQWKQVEKNIADVLDSKEKDEVKEELSKELGKYDWKVWENRLRTAYDKVNWERVNSQLNYAITQIQMDSLSRVYSRALVTLNKVQQQLCKDSLTGIPDTDITLCEIAEKQKQVQKALNILKAGRTKKIVHL